MELHEVNNLGFDEFTSIFGNIIEHCPVIAAGVWSKSPFQDFKDIQEGFGWTIDNLPLNVKEGILRCHPDLAGKLSSKGQLTLESSNEQKSAGLLDLSEDERRQLAESNECYKKKFNFPFVICARENKKQAIMTGIVRRLENDTNTEIHTGIEEVKKIGRIRLADIVRVDSVDAKL